MNSTGNNVTTENRLRPGFSPLSIWAFSIGTAIGWGSLVVTCNTYLASAGVMGTVIGLIIGMLVILVITWNLQYMICRNPDSGGIYTFAKKACGHDYGFLAAWFLLLTYLAILWANITAVPLFARYFFGDMFRLGFHYSIFGYDVYIEEVLLSMIVIILAGLLCAKTRRAMHVIMIISALAFVVGFTVCTVWAMARHGQSGCSYEPMYLPEHAAFGQIVRIAVISPWAFIGFENVAHFSEEYTFPVKRIRRILIISVAMSTLLYIFVTLLSITAYPAEYDSWLAYVQDMGNLKGIKAVPAFYAAYYYLGNAGVTILMIALMGAIITSLIGNTSALSRLLYAAGRDGDAPGRLHQLNRQGNPERAILLVVIISMLIPFLGRTAIGWIVDVTTLGATIIYGLASYAVFKDARTQGASLEKKTGFVGFVLMIGFVAMLLLPKLFSFNAMAQESYILFVFWSILGLAYFRMLVVKGRKQRYGHSVVVWLLLLVLVLFASMMWVAMMTQNVTENAMQHIHQYYYDVIGNGAMPGDDMDYLHQQSEQINSMNTWFTVASFVVFLFSVVVIYSNYQIMKRREEEHSQQLNVAEKKASTDQLTGVKNRLAYAMKEEELNERIADGQVGEFAIVICDINNLKQINDWLGHNEGDKCIRSICRMICKIYKHSPVFRLGGDEFAVILQGDDYEHRWELMDELNSQSRETAEENGSTVAAGMAEYTAEEDESVLTVFTRADEIMYDKKKSMKENG